MTPIIRDRHTLKPLDLSAVTVGQSVYAPSHNGGYRPAIIIGISQTNDEYSVTYQFTERNAKRIWERVSQPRTINNGQ